MYLAIFLLFSSLLFLFHLMLTFFYFFFYGSEFLFDFSLSFFACSSFHLSFVGDFFSFQFMSFIILISSVVIFYSIFYMDGDSTATRFISLVLLFIFSMSFLVVCPSLLGLIFGWDGLGITSFLLVVYYNNTSSLRSGLITVYTNRLGDIFLIFSLFLALPLGWMSVDLFFSSVPLIFSVFLILAGITKSAQLPFCSWLPAAIAAPTPVSSLVHSSTLVTAGVYLFIRFFFLFERVFFSLFFLLLFLATSLSAGAFACLEVDLKKLVAISTLSQLGLMMASLGLGHLFFSFFHIVRHALFKSLLFLSCGFLIMVGLGLQDMRFKGNKFFPRGSLVLMVIVANLSLCGFPFLSGFFSRDLIIESFIFFESGISLLLIFFFSCVLSVIYSFKMLNLALTSDLLCCPSLLTSFLSSNMLFMGFLFFWSIALGKVFSSLFMGGEIPLFYGFDKFIGVLFFFPLFIYFFASQVFFSFFIDMLWLNWFRGALFSKSQPFRYYILLGESTWLELVGPQGLVSLVYHRVSLGLHWGVSKPIFFLLLAGVIFRLYLPYSLLKALFWRNREGW